LASQRKYPAFGSPPAETTPREETTTMPKQEEFAALPGPWRWRPGPVTDWIDMEFILEEIDVSARTQLVATRLDTIAAVHRTLAEGAAKAAQIIAGAKGGSKQK
jgi:hypothetical protein